MLGVGCSRSVVLVVLDVRVLGVEYARSVEVEVMDEC